MSDIKGKNFNSRQNAHNRSHSPRTRSSASDTQMIFIVLLALGALGVVALLMSGGSSKGAQPRNIQSEEAKPRRESNPKLADPMDFSDLKQELYGNNAPGSGAVGENDAKNAREAIRDLGYGGDYRTTMNGMIGPGRYQTYDEAVRHLRPYLEQAQKQGALRPGIVEAIDADQKANEEHRKAYYSR